MIKSAKKCPFQDSIFPEQQTARVVSTIIISTLSVFTEKCNKSEPQTVDLHFWIIPTLLNNSVGMERLVKN